MNSDAIKRFLAAPLSGRDYFMSGAFLVVTKFLLDVLLSMVFLDKPWTPLGYFAPGRVAGSPEAEWSFFLAMLAMALPFIAIGVALTVRRLRTLGLHLALTFLFFVPFVNLILFAMLSVAPSPAVVPAGRRAPVPVQPIPAHAERLEYGHDDTGKPVTLFGRVMSGRRSGFWAAILIPQPFAILATLLSVYALHSYGWGVFVGLPFVLPMLSVILHGYAEERSIGSNLAVGLLSMLAYAFSLMFLSLEGAVCIIMALPLALPVATMGAAVGHAVQRTMLRAVPRIPLALLGILPALMPGGRTRLEGTTWYQHHMWPAGYWRLWADGIIHRIHLRVLGHVKGLAEAEQ